MLALKPEINNIISHLLNIEDYNNFKCINLLDYILDKYPNPTGTIYDDNSYESDYYKHMSDILDYASKMFKHLLLKVKLEFSLSDAILVLFLHDIVTTIKYTPVLTKTGVIDENGMIEEEIYEYETASYDEIIEILINKFNIKLTEEHKLVLKHIHGEGEDYRKNKKILSPLSAFCHSCELIKPLI